MTRMLRSDFYRFFKSKLFYGIAVATLLIAAVITTSIRQNIRIGISVFGNLTAFTSTDDIISVGLNYRKGLGVLIAILISIFIGQEYAWQTWQNKWLACKSRSKMFLSKALLSAAVSIFIFMLFQAAVLASSLSVREMFSSEYITMLTCGSLVYAALGVVICMLSVLIKSNTASLLTCIGYVLLSETIISMLKSVGEVSKTVAFALNWLISHSLYGMSIILSGSPDLSGQVAAIAINSLAIILLSCIFGTLVFRKYEL